MDVTRVKLWVPTLALAALTGLAGCQAAAVSESSPADASGGTTGMRAPQATQAPTAEPSGERQIARTGALTLRCEDVTVTADRLRELAESLGGFVSTESVWTSERVTPSGTSRIVFSVPANSMDRFMAEAAKAGELVTRSTTAKDVTEQVVDVEARIKTLRESIERIRALMNKAGSIADIAKVESELTRRQSELEALLATQKALQSQVERSTVSVTLLRQGQSDTDPNPLWQGLVRGWEALLNSIAALLMTIGAVLPFAAIGVLAGWPLVRFLRKRRAARAAAASAEQAGTESEQPDDDGGDQAQQDRG